MQYKIRNADSKDIHAIVEMNASLADYHVKIDRFYKPGSATRKNFRAHMKTILGKPRVRVLVAESNQNIVGYSVGFVQAARPFVAAKKIGRISDAFVERKYRRFGIAKALLREMLAWFRANKIRHVELSVDARNEIGVKAWHRLGFRAFMLRMRMDL